MFFGLIGYIYKILPYKFFGLLILLTRPALSSEIPFSRIFILAEFFLISLTREKMDKMKAYLCLKHNRLPSCKRGWGSSPLLKPIPHSNVVHRLKIRTYVVIQAKMIRLAIEQVNRNFFLEDILGATGSPQLEATPPGTVLIGTAPSRVETAPVKRSESHHRTQK